MIQDEYVGNMRGEKKHPSLLYVLSEMVEERNEDKPVRDQDLQPVYRRIKLAPTPHYTMVGIVGNSLATLGRYPTSRSVAQSFKKIESFFPLLVFSLLFSWVVRHIPTPSDSLTRYAPMRGCVLHLLMTLTEAEIRGISLARLEYPRTLRISDQGASNKVFLGLKRPSHEGQQDRWYYSLFKVQANFMLRTPTLCTYRHHHQRCCCRYGIPHSVGSRVSRRTIFSMRRTESD